jgi:2-keto-3-deoxy-L-fuconate dehydrogenase
MQNALVGKRVLVTESTEFMGPVLCEVFAEQGATVIASAEPLSRSEAADRAVRAAGEIDVLVANLALPAPATAAMEVDDSEWRRVFASASLPTSRPTHGSANGLRAKFRLAGSSPPARMPSSPRTCAARPPTASWARSSRSAAGGFRGDAA